MPQNGSFLAFDTSTDVMSIALTDGVRVWQHTGPGGARASTTLIPAILELLTDAGMALDDLQAIAFGRGPGSFTGLRTACAVAQGLAFGANRDKGGAGVAALPVDTLMALAEEARLHYPSTHTSVQHITALLDARMDEMYVQRYACHGGILSPVGDCQLVRPEHLESDNKDEGTLYAGNVFEVYAARLPSDLIKITCLPTAVAMLRLAPQLAAGGQCVAAAEALPLYVRDKVAQTTSEREAAKSIKLLVAAAP